MTKSTSTCWKPVCYCLEKEAEPEETDAEEVEQIGPQAKITNLIESSASKEDEMKAKQDMITAT